MRDELEQSAQAVARALSAADNDGNEGDYERWLPLGRAIVGNLPVDWSVSHTVDPEKAVATTDPAYRAAVEGLHKSAKRLLLDFLDPSARAIALGELATQIRALDRYLFSLGDRRNGHRR